MQPGKRAGKAHRRTAQRSSEANAQPPTERPAGFIGGFVGSFKLAGDVVRAVKSVGSDFITESDRSKQK